MLMVKTFSADRIIFTAEAFFRTDRVDLRYDRTRERRSDILIPRSSEHLFNGNKPKAFRLGK